MITVKIHNISKNIVEESREEKSAKCLKRDLEIEFSKNPRAEGCVHILTNVTFGGGQVSEADIVLLFDLKDYDVKLIDPNDGIQKNVVVQKLCYILELKSHSSFELKGNNFIVYYNGVPHDASSQSRQQKFDFSNYLSKMLGESPYIYNFLWFTSISNGAIDSAIRKSLNTNYSPDDNTLANNFSFRKLLQKTIFTTPKSVWWDNNNEGWMNAFVKNDKNFIYKIVSHFSERKTVVGELTQRKLNMISLKSANEDLKGLKDNVFTELSGRAGTGKTIKLIQKAITLKNASKGNRCLLLTYNQALVNDVKRLLYYAGETQKPGIKSVQIKTLHSFFLDLFVTLDVREDKIIDISSYYNKDGVYERDLKKLLEESIPSYSGSDIQYLKELEPKIDWDYILIDEAQDWLPIEKDILFKIYGPNRIVVANGVDQFMRSGNYLDWSEGIDPNNISKKNAQVSLRQKNNLASFVNSFANAFEINWEVEPNENFQGGDVFVLDGYSGYFHEILLEENKRKKAEPYDNLFLVPWQSTRGGYFEYYEDFLKEGIKIFDGSNPKNRDRYPVSSEESRLYNYESCRGLEGWSVICYKFDLMVQNKIDEIKRKVSSREISLPDDMISIDTFATDYAYLWALMPLTRAIDTLVITLDNPNGEIGHMLKRMSVHKNSKDYVHWTIS